MILFCPRCGAELAHAFRGEWFDTKQQCLECGVAVTDPPAMLAPTATEVTYGLDGWPVNDRAALTGALVEDDIPYRWEAGIVLAVPEAVEAVVDGILDDLEGSGDGRTEGANAGADGSGADGGEAAHAAMAELFVTSDRLHAAPADDYLFGQLAEVAELVAASLPPYGIDESVWRRIQELTTAVEEADGEDAIAQTSAALRDLLRPYV